MWVYFAEKALFMGLYCELYILLVLLSINHDS